MDLTRYPFVRPSLKNADEMMEAIKGLQAYGQLARKVERIRDWIRQKHGVEI